MRIATMVLSAILVSPLVSAQTAGQWWAALTPEKQKAQCLGIEQSNAERMQQGLPAVHPFEESCYPAPNTFGLINKPSAIGLQQIVAILRTVVRITAPQISVDSETSTVTVYGAPGKIEMVGWLIRELDQPAYNPAQRGAGLSIHELPVPRTEQDQPGKNDEAIRVFLLEHTATQRAYQEILTSLRTVGDVQMAFGDSEQFTLVVRAPAAQMALASYLIKQLDVARGSPTAAADFLYRPPDRPFLPAPPSSGVAPADVVRVFYTARATEPKAIQQIVNAVRTVAGIQKMFMDTAVAAIPVRGTASEIATAKWLINSLDIPADGHTFLATGTREFHLPAIVSDDGAMRVFYLGQNIKPEGLQSVLGQLQSQQPTMKSAVCDFAGALIVSGSADQMAQAERSIEVGLLVVN